MAGPQNSVSEIWLRIEQLLRSRAPEVFETLAGGASSTELDDLEAALQLTLPADLRKSLEIHNGQQDESGVLRFCGVYGLMSTCDILRDWRMLTDLAIDFDKRRGVYSPESNSFNGDWWRRSCVPFAHCEGNYVCVDTHAALGAKIGHVVYYNHDGSMEESNIPNFANWLGRVASALEDGRWDREQYGYFRVHPDLGDQ